jgi:2-phosphosulfolactate phosphatase
VGKTVVIDSLPECVWRYKEGWAVVAVDVIRATTTAITAAATGRRCYPAPTVEAAMEVAQKLTNPLLAGEFSGDVPTAFEMDNSPSQVHGRTDTHRPLVLVSSSGTKVIHEAAGCEATYLGCFRNHSVLADYLAGRHLRIAVIGAGSKGEFREEDQICCAWIAAALISQGYSPETPETAEVVGLWRHAPPKACLRSNSVAFLKRTGRLSDLDFIMNHIDDLRAVFTVEEGEVKTVPEEQIPAPHPVAAGPPHRWPQPRGYDR